MQVLKSVSTPSGLLQSVCIKMCIQFQGEPGISVVLILLQLAVCIGVDSRVIFSEEIR